MKPYLLIATSLLLSAAPLSAADSINNGTMTGTLYFDPALGMARDFEMKQAMEISMKNPADPTGTMTIPMKQEIQMELTKIEDLK